MYWAACDGELAECKALLSRGASAHYVKSENNQTPLHVASLSGKTEVCRLLLDADADLQCTDSDGDTPLHLASLSGHLETVQLLVTRGARTDATDGDGRMPIHLAAQENRHEVVNYLVTEAAVNVNVVSANSSVLLLRHW